MQVRYKGEEVEVCNSLWRAREHGEIVNGLAPVSLEVLSKDMDGVFETPESWKNFVRSIYLGETSFLGEFLAKAQSVSQINHETVLYTYTTPVPIITGWKAGDRQLKMVVSEMQNIKLKLSYKSQYRIAGEYQSGKYQELWEIEVFGELLPPSIDEESVRDTV